MGNKHDEPGKVRLPQEVAEQWPEVGYGDVHIDNFYEVLWWIADMGYSIVPDSEVDR